MQTRNPLEDLVLACSVDPTTVHGLVLELVRLKGLLVEVDMQLKMDELLLEVEIRCGLLA